MGVMRLSTFLKLTRNLKSIPLKSRVVYKVLCFLGKVYTWLQGMLGGLAIGAHRQVSTHRIIITLQVLGPVGVRWV